MVLKHVAQTPRLLVIAAAMLDAQALSRGNLHVVDVIAVPDRLDNRVGEAKGEDVLHGLLTEVVNDPIDLIFFKHLMDNRVQLPRGVEVASKWLLDDHTRPSAGIAAAMDQAVFR